MKNMKEDADYKIKNYVPDSLGYGEAKYQAASF